jgi:hypothetical protein
MALAARPRRGTARGDYVPAHAEACCPSGGAPQQPENMVAALGTGLTSADRLLAALGAIQTARIPLCTRPKISSRDAAIFSARGTGMDWQPVLSAADQARDAGFVWHEGRGVKWRTAHQEADRTLIAIWCSLFGARIARRNLLFANKLFDSLLVPLTFRVEPCNED